jgi:hypothetical protein
MPNIEIYGMGLGFNGRGSKLRSKIFELFKDKGYAREIVVTIINSSVEDIHGNNQPFIRLLNDCQEHTQEILEILQTLDIDIEHSKLSSFIPKKSSKQEV